MAFDSIGNLKFMFLMVNLKFLEKVMLEKKTEFCLCIVSTVQWEKKHICALATYPHVLGYLCDFYDV